MTQHVATKVCEAGRGKNRIGGCGLFKPLTEFNRRTSMKDGLDKICRDCASARSKAFYATPEGKAKRSVYHKRYNADPENRAKRSAKDKAARRTDSERLALQKLNSNLRRYGLANPQDVLTSFGQHNTCTVCDKPCRSGKRLAMDHDHGPAYGDRRFRGWLCSDCNTSLGKFEDSPFPLVDLAIYAALESRPHSLGDNPAHLVNEIRELRDDLHDAFNRLHEERATRMKPPA
jgi:hypothetical protein